MKLQVGDRVIRIKSLRIYDDYFLANGGEFNKIYTVTSIKPNLHGLYIDDIPNIFAASQFRKIEKCCTL